MTTAIYFYTPESSGVWTISSPDAVEPEHIAKFPLADGQSKLSLRYSLVDGGLVDNYPTQTDDEVITLLAEAEALKVAELAANAPKVPKPIAPIAFKLRFTTEERVAIYESNDLVVKDFRSLLDDPRLQYVDLNLQTTVDAINYLAFKNLITAERVAELLV